jgi:RNA polymerase sigma-70 factor, ECF subfamily
MNRLNDEPSPSDAIEKNEHSHQIHQAIGQLPENQRTAFLLSKYEDLSGRQIAEIMNTTVTAVDSLIFRAKANLQKNLFNLYKKK